MIIISRHDKNLEVHREGKDEIIPNGVDGVDSYKNESIDFQMSIYDQSSVCTSPPVHPCLTIEEDK